MLRRKRQVACINGNIKERNGAEISSAWLHRDEVPQPWLAEHKSQAPNSLKSSQGLQQNLGEPKRVWEQRWISW